MLTAEEKKIQKLKNQNENRHFTAWEDMMNQILEFDPPEQKELAWAMLLYGTKDYDVKFKDPGLRAAFTGIKGTINRGKVKQRNGSKGGGQPGNQNARKAPAKDPNGKRGESFQEPKPGIEKAMDQDQKSEYIEKRFGFYRRVQENNPGIDNETAWKMAINCLIGVIGEEEYKKYFPDETNE